MNNIYAQSKSGNILELRSDINEIEKDRIINIFMNLFLMDKYSKYFLINTKTNINDNPNYNSFYVAINKNMIIGEKITNNILPIINKNDKIDLILPYPIKANEKILFDIRINYNNFNYSDILYKFDKKE